MISEHSAHSTTLPVNMHTYMHTYMFVVVNFDALAQASDIRIERRQLVSLCWIQDSNLEVSRHLFASKPNAHSQTDWAIEDEAKILNSTARAYDEWAFSPLDFTAGWLSHLAVAMYMFVVVNFDALAQASDIHTYVRTYVILKYVRTYAHASIHTYVHTCLLLISMLWHRQALFESKGDKLSRTWKSQYTYSPADWMPTNKPTKLSKFKLTSFL